MECGGSASAFQSRRKIVAPPRGGPSDPRSRIRIGHRPCPTSPSSAAIYFSIMKTAVATLGDILASLLSANADRLLRQSGDSLRRLRVITAIFLVATSAYADGTAQSTEAKILKNVAQDIEKLKPNFPQLEDFSVRKHFDSSLKRRPVPAIVYSFHTHAPKHIGGWTSGVPNPDHDGVWFYIDLHDPNSTAQIHTQPVTMPICLGDKRVSFLSLEGAGTKSLDPAIREILRKHGAHECR